MLPPPPPGVFRRSFDLGFHDLDATGAFRFRSLLSLVQSVAGDHADALGWNHEEQWNKGLFWVLGRMSVEFSTWPLRPERLVVDTWTRGTRSVMLLRDFRFGTPEAPMGRATTAWVLLKDRRPQRPEVPTASAHWVRAEDPLVDLPPSLPPLVTTGAAGVVAEALVLATHALAATWDDIDANGHVGNVQSLGWCLDRHDFAFLTGHRPSFLHVNYLAEMFCGQRFTVSLREAVDDQGDAGTRVFDYAVVRDEDQVPTLRARLGFRPITSTP